MITERYIVIANVYMEEVEGVKSRDERCFRLWEDRRRSRKLDLFINVVWAGGV